MKSYRMWFVDPYGIQFSPEMYFRYREDAVEYAKTFAYASTAMILETVRKPK